jgi:quercetin dioxygenase-like cupin family protein
MKHTDGGEQIVELASLYALGALPEDEAGEFATHLETGCPECFAEVEPARLVVSALGLAGPALDPPASVRAKLLAQLRPTVAPAEHEHDSFVTVRADEGEWREMFKGISVKQLFRDETRGTVTSLYRVGPGAGFPSHDHDGFEQCLIIEGDFHLDDQTYGPGDFTCALPGSTHQVSYSEGGALLLIVAAASYNMSHQLRA